MFTVNWNPKSCVLLHVPHSGYYIPEKARAEIVLSDKNLILEQSLVNDIATDRISSEVINLSEKINPTLFLNRLSRLVVDPERFLGENEVMNKRGLGAVYTKTQHGAILRQKDYDSTRLLNEFYHPYHEAFDNVVDKIVSEHGRVVILDIHSYPKFRYPSETSSFDTHRFEICLGTDPYHTSSTLLDVARGAFDNGHFDCGVNSPYEGTFVPSGHFQKSNKVESLMIEIRRDVYGKMNKNNGGFLFKKRFNSLSKSISKIVDFYAQV